MDINSRWSVALANPTSSLNSERGFVRQVGQEALPQCGHSTNTDRRTGDQQIKTLMCQPIVRLIVIATHLKGDENGFHVGMQSVCTHGQNFPSVGPRCPKDLESMVLWFLVILTRSVVSMPYLLDCTNHACHQSCSCRSICVALCLGSPSLPAPDDWFSYEARRLA